MFVWPKLALKLCHQHGKAVWMNVASLCFGAEAKEFGLQILGELAKAFHKCLNKSDLNDRNIG